MSNFFVANLRNSQLLRAIRASNLNILNPIYFFQNHPEVPQAPNNKINLKEHLL